MAQSPSGTVATVVNGHTFTIDPRYNLKDARILGKGSFGVVTTAVDTIRKQDIAIKRIRPFANDEWDARHTLREIRLLKLLGPHPNVSEEISFKFPSFFLSY
jgi:serine/threonine protein kinase